MLDCFGVLQNAHAFSCQHIKQEISFDFLPVHKFLLVAANVLIFFEKVRNRVIYMTKTFSSNLA